MLDAVSETGIGAEGVEEIVCLVPGEVAIGLVLEPAERKARPATRL